MGPMCNKEATWCLSVGLDLEHPLPALTWTFIIIVPQYQRKSNIPECPYDVGQEDNVEDDDKEDRNSEEPGVALEFQPYNLIFLSMLSMFGVNVRHSLGKLKCARLVGNILVPWKSTQHSELFFSCKRH